MVSKEEQLKQYASLVQDESRFDARRIESKDQSGICLNCGTEYIQFKGFSSRDPYQEWTRPVPCPTCFYNPALSEVLLNNVVKDYVKVVLSRGKVKVKSKEAVAKIHSIILNNWPKNLESIIQIQKESKK